MQYSEQTEGGDPLYGFLLSTLSLSSTSAEAEAGNLRVILLIFEASSESESRTTLTFLDFLITKTFLDFPDS